MSGLGRTRIYCSCSGVSIVLLLHYWVRISQVMLVRRNVKGLLNVVQRVSKWGLGVLMIRIFIGALCLVEIPVLEAIFLKRGQMFCAGCIQRVRRMVDVGMISVCVFRMYVH